MSHAIMSRTILPALLLLAVLALAAPSRAAEPMAFKSESIQLPFGSSDFPPGPGVDAVKKNCLLCHSPRMILYQPTLTKAQWTKEVDKMINVFKAPVAKDDIPAILDYLTHFQAAKD
jgi:hypothetical protein